MFWAWPEARGVDDSGITRFSFAGAGGLPCELLAGFGTSFVFPLCFGVFSPLLGCMSGVADGGVGYTRSHAGLKSRVH